MLHTCGACAETTKVTTKWLSKSVQPALREDIRSPVDALIKKTKTKFSVDVSRSVAYRARRNVVGVVQGDHKQQYLRLRDYLQAVLDTNPGSRCIVTTFVDPKTLHRLLDSSTCSTVWQLQRKGFLMVVDHL